MRTRLRARYRLKNKLPLSFAQSQSFCAAHADIYADKRINAFTLAEVLITLGIIGIVAAMTLPALVQSYNNHLTETRLKKFYSIINQAILQSVNVNGPYEGWSYWNDDTRDEDGNLINRQEDNHASFQRYLVPYIKITSVKKLKYTAGEEAGEEFYLYSLADGSAFSYARHENRDITFYPSHAERCIERNPAPVGVCGFWFSFYPIRKTWSWAQHYQKGMEPGMYNWDGKDEAFLYNDSVRGCKTGGGYCTALIQRNGWRVPKDYPKKIRY